MKLKITLSSLESEPGSPVYLSCSPIFYNARFSRHLIFSLLALFFMSRMEAQDSLSFNYLGTTYWYKNVTHTNLPDTSLSHKFIVDHPHSGIFLIKPDSGQYNCHAFAWANNMNVWVDTKGENAPPYYRDVAPQIFYDSTTYYRRTFSVDSAEIAIYGPPDSPYHSALRLTNSNSSNGYAKTFLKRYPQYVGWWISKWDGDYLIIHQLDSCTYYFYPRGNQVTFYRKNLDPPNSNNLEYNGNDYSLRSPNLLCYTAVPVKLSNADGSLAIDSFPSGFSVSWSCSSNITITDTNAYPAMAKANSNGHSGWIRARIHFPNSTSDTVARWQLWVGSPETINSVTNSQFDNGQAGWPPTESWSEFYAHPFTETDLISPNPIDQHGVMTYTWSSSPLTFYQDPATDNYRYAAGGFTSWGATTMTVHASNTCGFVSMYGNFIIASSGLLFSMSPNPASGSVTISISDKNTPGAATGETKSAATSRPATYTVRIRDYYGNLYYTATQTGTSFTLPVGSLKAGNYVVELSDGKISSSKLLQVNH